MGEETGLRCLGPGPTETVQPQNMARDMRLWNLEEEGQNYLCSEKKGTDQLRIYLAADLHLLAYAQSRISHDAAQILREADDNLFNFNISFINSYDPHHLFCASANK